MKNNSNTIQLPANLLSIGFVGPSHAGKSASFKACGEALKKEFAGNTKVRIFLAEEAANAITMSRENYGIPCQNRGLAFQFTVLALQMGFLEEAIEYAISHPTQFVVCISDRSCIDSFSSYLSESQRTVLNYDALQRFYHKFYFFLFDPCFLNDSEAGNQHRYESSVDEYLKLSDEAAFTYLKSNLIEADNVEVVLPFPTIEAKKREVAERLVSFINSEIKKGAEHNE